MDKSITTYTSTDNPSQCQTRQWKADMTVDGNTGNFVIYANTTASLGQANSPNTKPIDIDTNEKTNVLLSMLAEMWKDIHELKNSINELKDSSLRSQCTKQ